VSRLRALLDNSLEIVIAWARLQAVCSLLGAFLGVGYWIWFGDARYGGLAAVAVALAALCGWFGFWLFGNPEWRRGAADDRAA
jgi:hypothetical protein